MVDKCVLGRYVIWVLSSFGDYFDKRTDRFGNVIALQECLAGMPCRRALVTANCAATIAGSVHIETSQNARIARYNELNIIR